jgi:type VI secretion system protein ImpK
VAGGQDPLVRAAGPLLLLAGRLRYAGTAPDMAGLRRQLIAEVRGFEERAQQAGVSTDQIAAARYALCSTLDEAILSTPWGAQTDWASQPLLVVFHRETWGGEKFFQMVDRTRSEPQRYAGLLEVFYLCLSVGFAGKFAIDPQGSLQLERLQHELYELLRGLREPHAVPLSPRWQGIEDRRNPLFRYVPLWVVAAVAVALTAGAWLYYRSTLTSASEPVLASLSQVGLEPYAASAPAAAPLISLVTLLKPEIDAGVLTVEEQGAKSTITLTAPDLFASGSTQVNARYTALLGRVGQALEQVPGSILVVGHTDDVPIRSFKFQNNFELSNARARAVVEALDRTLTNPSRVISTGVGATQPRYLPAELPANRARNRRVEIVHVAQGAEP